MVRAGKRGVGVLAAAWLLATLPVVASAQAVTETEVISELKQDGFRVVNTGTTLLGRVRITALGAEGVREVVLNPRNGKVLRDVIIDKADDVAVESHTLASVAPAVTETVAPAATVVEQPAAVAAAETEVAAVAPAAAAAEAAVAAEPSQAPAQDSGMESGPATGLGTGPDAGLGTGLGTAAE